MDTSPRLPDILRAEYSPRKLSRSDIDPATLEPNPSPLDRLNIALRHVNEASKTLTNDREQLDGIEATLYVNFVSKDCHGVKFSAEEIAGWSVNKLLFEILLKLHGEIDRLKQQITVDAVVRNKRAASDNRNCEFCGNAATKIERFDRDVYVCDECSAASQ